MIFKSFTPLATIGLILGTMAASAQTAPSPATAAVAAGGSRPVSVRSSLGGVTATAAALSGRGFGLGIVGQGLGGVTGNTGNTGILPGVVPSGTSGAVPYSARLNMRQRNILFQTSRLQSIRRIDGNSVTFTVQTGVQIPSTTPLYRLPQQLIQAFPRYYPYRYFAVDNNVIIVDPMTFVVVDVLPG